MQALGKWSARNYSKKKTLLNVNINSAQFCSDSFYVRKCHLKSAVYHSHLLPTRSCEPVSKPKHYCFVLRETHISM